MNEGATHWEGCWREHHECAVLKLESLFSLVDKQAEDEGLWFVALTCAEAYMQQELRRLHAAIEAGRGAQ